MQAWGKKVQNSHKKRCKEYENIILSVNILKVKLFEGIYSRCAKGPPHGQSVKMHTLYHVASFPVYFWSLILEQTVFRCLVFLQKFTLSKMAFHIYGYWQENIYHSERTHYRGTCQFTGLIHMIFIGCPTGNGRQPTHYSVDFSIHLFIHLLLEKQISSSPHLAPQNSIVLAGQSNKDKLMYRTHNRAI